MKLGARERKVALAAALVLTLVAASWVDGHEEADASRVSVRRAAPRAPSPARPAAPALASGDDAVALDRLSRRGSALSKDDLFVARSWEAEAQQEAAKNVKPEPPPKPVAPPLPFVYMGKLLEKGELTVFLTQGNRDIIAKAGDTIDNTYRVDEVNLEGMLLTYLPLHEKQRLPFGSAN